MFASHAVLCPFASSHGTDAGVQRVGAKAGSCLLFSEKLTHATLPWSGAATERRTVFYKYVPYGLHHNDFGYDLSDPGLTRKQRRRLAFPDSWLSVDKSARAKQAVPAPVNASLCVSVCLFVSMCCMYNYCPEQVQLQHGPDQWHCHANGEASARL